MNHSEFHIRNSAFELSPASTPEHKNVLIVNGGPGSGKTVVAINLLVELTQRKMSTAEMRIPNRVPITSPVRTRNSNFAPFDIRNSSFEI